MAEDLFLGKDQIHEFLWLVILGGFVCFAMAWGIGANDVANVCIYLQHSGSKCITIQYMKLHRHLEHQ